MTRVNLHFFTLIYGDYPLEPVLYARIVHLADYKSALSAQEILGDKILICKFFSKTLFRSTTK